MANILIMAPTPIAAISAASGTGVANLLTPDPREVWKDSSDDVPTTILIDLGVERLIDTVFLGCIMSASPTATWAITAGLAAYDEIVLTGGRMRLAEDDWRIRTMSHALWHGAEQLVRYLQIIVHNIGGVAPLSIGTVMVGDAFQPRYNYEWGAGRNVKDTGVVTRLPTGGIARVQGARFGTFSWTLGDLTDAETERLYELQLDRGESSPVLVVEDPADTRGLRNRIHYGQLSELRAFERRNSEQTTWQMAVEDWAVEPATIHEPRTIPALTLGGIPLTLGGEILTLGN